MLQEGTIKSFHERYQDALRLLFSHNSGKAVCARHGKRPGSERGNTEPTFIHFAPLN